MYPLSGQPQCRDFTHQDDSSVGYLFIHKNLYWQNDKSTVDLEVSRCFRP